jgi:excisionase family DNA binding protein
MGKDKIVTGEAQLNNLETTAQRLAVSIWTVRKWVQTGQLASLKLGARRLVAESEIQRAISQGLRDLAA